jgi:hypothetical protein
MTAFKFTALLSTAHLVRQAAVSALKSLFEETSGFRMLGVTLAEQLLGAENTDLYHPLKKYQKPITWDVLMLERKIC